MFVIYKKRWIIAAELFKYKNVWQRTSVKYNNTWNKTCNKK